MGFLCVNESGKMVAMRATDFHPRLNFVRRRTIQNSSPTKETLVMERNGARCIKIVLQKWQKVTANLTFCIFASDIT